MTNIVAVSTIQELATHAASANSVAFLSMPGRSGMFECRAGLPPADDPLHGIYVPSATSGYHWARLWDGVNGKPEWFGAVVGDGSASARTATLAALNAATALLPSIALSAGTYHIDGTWRIRGTTGPRVTGLGRDKTMVSSNHPAAHILHCGADETGGRDPQPYLERPYLQGMTLVRTVHAVVPSNPEDDSQIGHGLHMKYNSNATVREIDTAGFTPKGAPMGSNLVGTYWANALSALWEDCFDYMVGTGARCYSFVLDGTKYDAKNKFPSLIVFRGREIRMTNAGSAGLSRGMLILGSYTDMQVDRVETAGVHNGLLCIGGGGNAHFNSHWHDSYKEDGIKLDRTGAGNGENVTFVDCYCAPGGGATGQPFTLTNAQNVQIVAAQVTSYPHGGDGKVGMMLSHCVNCTVSGQVVNHSTGVKLHNCHGCDVDAKVMQTAGAAIEGIRIEGGYGNKARCGIVGVPGSVGFGTAVALAATGGNYVDLSGVLDSAVKNRLTLDGSVVNNAGNVAGQNFVIRPGAPFNAART